MRAGAGAGDRSRAVTTRVCVSAAETGCQQTKPVAAGAEGSACSLSLSLSLSLFLYPGRVLGTPSPVTRPLRLAPVLLPPPSRPGPGRREGTKQRSERAAFTRTFEFPCPAAGGRSNPPPPPLARLLLATSSLSLPASSSHSSFPPSRDCRGEAFAVITHGRFPLIAVASISLYLQNWTCSPPPRPHPQARPAP